MQIVKFKNGKYGVRKLTIFGYKFALNKHGLWCHKSDDISIEVETIDKARGLMEDLERLSSINNDMGEPIED